MLFRESEEQRRKRALENSLGQIINTLQAVKNDPRATWEDKIKAVAYVHSLFPELRRYMMWFLNPPNTPVIQTYTPPELPRK